MFPVAYSWLKEEQGPNMLRQMLGLFGTVEFAGTPDNPVIMEWASETGHPEYKHDAVPWCGLTMAVVAKRAGWPYNPRGNALWAQNWIDWEDHSPIPMLGDVLVFGRTGGGHVSMYVGEDEHVYHIMGGNQMDQVNIEQKPKAALLGARRPHWVNAQPANVRVVHLRPSGEPRA